MHVAKLQKEVHLLTPAQRHQHLPSFCKESSQAKRHLTPLTWSTRRLTSLTAKLLLRRVHLLFPARKNFMRFPSFMMRSFIVGRSTLCSLFLAHSLRGMRQQLEAWGSKWNANTIARYERRAHCIFLTSRCNFLQPPFLIVVNPFVVPDFAP